ncbi:adenylyl-sulfate kinase [Umezawaea sp.]|uniref:adenylyl-sulfate kinase n=1 Tax=Umezawaea sp. TaxID=1955258 RepID=UPI002ED5AC34
MGAAPQGARASAAGLTVWLTGLPSAGKSTIADGVAARLRAEGRRVEVLDGDEVRTNLTRDLGFSRSDREENVRRIGFVASLLARHGVITLVPVIAPYASSRHQVRSGHTDLGLDFVETYVATPVSVCSSRDVKGLYALQRDGGLSGLTGVDDPYEAPAEPDLVVQAHIQTPEESIDTVHAFVLTRIPR